MAARRRNADRRNWPKNLYQNSAGTFWYRNPKTGKTYSLGKDLRVAADQARAANADLEYRKGHVSLIQRMNGAETTVAEWCRRYKEIFIDRGNSNPRTQANVSSDLEAIKKAPFKDYALYKVTPNDVSKWIKSIAGTVSASRGGQLRSRLSDMFNEAIAEALLEAGKNPVSAIRKPKSKVMRQRLTLDDFTKIVAAARKDPGMVWAARAFLLALLTGQRREDIKNMKFSDVRDGFVWVEQGKSQGATKLKIPVTLGLKSIKLTIDDVIRDFRDDIVSKHVIHYVRARGTSKPGQSPLIGKLSEVFAQFRDEAGIVVEDGKTAPTFHEIRSLSARLYGDEFGAEFAQALLGHKSAQMTELYRDARGREWAEVKIRSS